MVWNPQTDPLMQHGGRLDVEAEPQVKAKKEAHPKKLTPLWIVIPIVTVIMVVFLGGSLMLGLWSLRTSPVYVEAMNSLRQNKDATAMLGEPIVDDWMPIGSINIENRRGDADLQIGVRGPKGHGTLRVVATLDQARWTYSVLRLSVDGEEIDLNSDVDDN